VRRRPQPVEQRAQPLHGELRRRRDGRRPELVQARVEGLCSRGTSGTLPTCPARASATCGSTSSPIRARLVRVKVRVRVRVRVRVTRPGGESTARAVRRQQVEKLGGRQPLVDNVHELGVRGRRERGEVEAAKRVCLAQRVEVPSFGKPWSMR
jgi:hypothetical protein